MNQAFCSCKRCTVIICLDDLICNKNCFLPVLFVDTIDVDCAEGEADVDNDEDEEEDKDVHHHVAHGDDDRSYLSVHQPDLERKGKPDVRECHTKSFSCSPRIPPKNVITLNVRYFLRRASAPKQDETGNCCLCLL